SADIRRNNKRVREKKPRKKNLPRTFRLINSFWKNKQLFINSNDKLGGIKIMKIVILKLCWLGDLYISSRYICFAY
ncbi:MAG TPA: hypothetical protein VFN30_13485, partial [Chitinophagaceae bacterium]|nr:hypothetical protein [Chitinophagaceae bacterium]